ncbi:MAG: NIPSNAP family protein [Arenicellales bacterium]|jgi:hypothetical protein|nr:NIPSNAP family protein [Acidiferrobacteraceae bacterium]MDP7569121.1 NIPSNAP family protein [Arenicellales bacterium]MDP7618009.1 NIPSNAP family protein [Arenicellales bacterium]HJP45575.1 NIPSNAP family protein [Arenicellales bacterium]|tara:strand:- start:1457 stop:1789 length:333 start_codon:yes stop_codon:yes gene_type:complete
MIYEVRRYETMPGMMPALHELMANVAMPVFEKVGMRVVGAWEPLVGDYSNVLTYVLAWECMNERAEKWDVFFSHSDWKMGRREAVKKLGKPMVSREFHFFLSPTSYSPLQ